MTLVSPVLRLLARSFGRRSPAIIVVLLLAPAVGLNSALAELVMRLMFREAPGVRAPGDLVEVAGLRYEDYHAFAASSRTMEVAGYARTRADLANGTDGTSVQLECGTPNYLTVLGVSAYIGHVFSGKEAKQDPAVVVLGHGFWLRYYGGDPAVLGERVTVNRRLYTVVGVAPPRFTGVESRAVDMWVPLVPGGENCSAFGSFGNTNLAGVGRLRQGYTQQQASSEWSLYATSTPERDKSIEQFATTDRWRLRRDQEVLQWLGGGCLVVMLLACFNAAAVFSISAMKRRREMAVRYSLGASRSRLWMLLVGESLGTGLLCLVLGWSVAKLSGVIFDRYYLTAGAAAAGFRLWFICGALALVACVLSGALPALRASQRDFVTLLRADSLGADSSRGIRNRVLAVQVALAFALFAVAGLFLRSVENLKTGLGFDIDTTIAVTLDPHRSKYEDDNLLQDARDLLYRQLKHSPAIDSAAIASSVPLNGGSFVGVSESVDGAKQLSGLNLVSHEYLSTIGGSLLKGRDLTAYDTASSPPVALVSDELARRLWGATDTVGRCVFVGGHPSCVTVVGIVRSLRTREVTKPLPAVFMPLQQNPENRTPFTGRTILVKPKRHQSVVSVRKALAACGLQMPAEVLTLSEVADPFTRSWRLGATCFGLVGTLAFALAAVGVYCSLSLLVRQRTPEIGVRLALGATRLHIFGTALREGMSFLLFGWIAGTVLAVTLTRVVRHLLFDIVSLDLVTFLAVTAAVFGLGAVACVVPSWQASRLDVLRALRVE